MRKENNKYLNLTFKLMELTILREKTVLIARMAALKQGMAADFDSKRFFFRASDVLKDTIAFVDHEGLLCICALTQRQITPHHVNRKGSRLFG